jgi:hypothetical protein
MKLGLVVGMGFLLASARVASADLADSYPQTVVDRPLVLLPGMTELFVDEQLSSTTTQNLGNRTPDLEVVHAFGPIEIMADLGEYAELHVSLATHTMPETVEIYGLTGVSQKDGSLHEAQGAYAGQRFHLLPGLLAAVGGIGFTVSENRLRDSTGMLSWSQVLEGFANARVEVQLARLLALTAGISGEVPLVHFGGPDFVSSLAAGGGFILTLGTWDIYAYVGLQDLTDRRLLYLTAGFSKRWGR